MKSALSPAHTLCQVCLHFGTEHGIFQHLPAEDFPHGHLVLVALSFGALLSWAPSDMLRLLSLRLGSSKNLFIGLAVRLRDPVECEPGLLIGLDCGVDRRSRWEGESDFRPGLIGAILYDEVRR